MPSKIVRVEIGPNGLPIRIFRNKDWLNCENVQKMDRSHAVGAIRAQVYERSETENGLHECEKCGKMITWETMEMNEIVPRGVGGGKTAGEVSLNNCEALCSQCHQGHPDSAHGNRRWHTAKIKDQNDTT